MKPVPHGEPYAGKLHVRFDEGYPPKNGEVRFEGSRRPSGRTRQQGASRSTLHPFELLAHRAFFLDDKEKGLVARTNQDRPMSPVQEHKLA